MEPGKPHTLETDAPRAGTTSVSCRTFPADRTAPRAAATWLRAVASGLSPSRLADAELCMDELVTNVVRYGWADTDPGPRSVTLRIDRIGCEVEITVEDAGRPFDPTAAPLAPIAHSLDEAVPGGRGLLLVRSIAPRVAYERSNGVNRTTIAFPLEGVAEA
jgi:anti-sigma regulatory factor (Ser/Thr protein kinase)